jgi:hypothetical protein
MKEGHASAWFVVSFLVLCGLCLVVIASSSQADDW